MPDTDPTSSATSGRSRSLAVKSGLVAAGLIAGGVLATTLTATAATPSPSASPRAGSSGSSGTATPQQGQPGVQENDGIPESQEHHGHGGRGRGLSLSGTVTAVTGSSVTIKTATARTTYAVASTSDIDKNGEAQLSDLVVGDAVTFSVTSASAPTIDKLHAVDETRDRPQAPSGTFTAPSGTATPGGFGAYGDPSLDSGTAGSTT